MLLYLIKTPAGSQYKFTWDHLKALHTTAHQTPEEPKEMEPPTPCYCTTHNHNYTNYCTHNTCYAGQAICAAAKAIFWSSDPSKAACHTSAY